MTFSVITSLLILQYFLFLHKLLSTHLSNLQFLSIVNLIIFQLRNLQFLKLLLLLESTVLFLLPLQPFLTLIFTHVTDISIELAKSCMILSVFLLNLFPFVDLLYVIHLVMFVMLFLTAFLFLPINTLFYKPFCGKL